MNDRMLTFDEVRAIVADRPPGPLGDEVLDELLDVIADDIAAMWPSAPESAAFSYAATQVAAALKLGPPDGGRGHRGHSPAPRPAPEALLA